MSLMDSLIPKARTAGMTIVLPEGQDPRVMQAARAITDLGVANVKVLATPEETAVSAEGVDLGDKVEIIDWLNAPEAEELAAALWERRKAKGLTMEQARQMVQKRLYFAGLMLNGNMADGLVAGSIASTADMLRSAFHCVGTAPGIKTGSSCFLMDLREPTPAGDRVLIFADCGVNPDPDAEQLVDIAISTMQSHRALIGTTPRVAFLAFSTKGSAQHPALQKIQKATELTKLRIEAEGIEAWVDGEMQGDAALVPAVAGKKAPGSAIQGNANVLIFPDLNSGNICYKLTERLAGASAYGPILQGLAKPVNDLSRGCSVDDIIGVAAITVCQALVS